MKRNWSKKALSLLMAGTMMAGLAGCGSDAAQNDSSAAASTAQSSAAQSTDASTSDNPLRPDTKHVLRNHISFLSCAMTSEEER